MNLTDTEKVDLLFSLWDAEQKISSSHKLSPEIINLRKEAELNLKELKTASFVSVH